MLGPSRFSAAKHRRDELVDAPVPSVCEYTLVPPAQRLDRRAT